MHFLHQSQTKGKGEILKADGNTSHQTAEGILVLEFEVRSQFMAFVLTRSPLFEA